MRRQLTQRPDHDGVWLLERQRRDVAKPRGLEGRPREVHVPEFGLQPGAENVNALRWHRPFDDAVDNVLVIGQAALFAAQINHVSEIIEDPSRLSTTEFENTLS